MKNKLFFLGALLISAFSFGQSNTFPSTGNVGIGTTSPVVKLDVRANLLSPSEYLAFFGAYSSVRGDITARGLYIENKYEITIPATSNSTILQYTSGDPNVSSAKKGFVGFNSKATTNTTISAVSFGSNGSEFMRINQDGKVRIANGANDLKTPNGYRLFVEEGILTEKVKVAIKTTANWSDYVFNEDYKLMPLNDVESFLIKNKHLPNVPSAAEMVENGLDVAQMDAKLLEKVEELTLYVIEQNKQIEELKAAIQVLMEKK